MTKNLLIKIILTLFIISILLFFTFQILKPKIDNTKLISEDKYDFIKKNLISGGPKKDGIPSIDNPKYISAKNSNLTDDAQIFGVNYNGFIVAYPRNILYWHEIVNENVKGQKISITFCPLTGSVIGYLDYELGVSGELYNSNLVMYDRKTGSRIPQILGFGIEGDLKAKKLKTFNIKITTWKNWKTLHPNTQVLSQDTGFSRDYTKSPYPGYETIFRLWFPLTNKDTRLQTKEKVFVIDNNNNQIAILQDNFQNKYPKGLNISLGTEKIKITYDKKLNILQTNKTNLKSFQVYWFAISSDYPNITLIR